MKHHYQVCMEDCLRETSKNVFCKSLAGWTFALYPYYMENITRSLDNPYYQMAADIFDPYGKGLD